MNTLEPSDSMRAMSRKTSFTYKLTPEQAETLAAIINSGTYAPVKVEHTVAAGRTNDCSIALYKSNKCLVQGKGAEDFVTFVLEPLVLQEAGLGYEEILNPEAAKPHMGVDESGKGDLFGPLVISAAFVNEDIVPKLKEMNVRDSKNITSSAKAMEMGREIRKLLGTRQSIVKIGPGAYNRLYSKMRNVNSILSWGHARAIENLLEVLPECPKAISDQFGNKKQVERALMQKGRGIELVQMHRAESDIAVAAASILAREAFLSELNKMEQKYETKIPRGASPTAREAAVELARREGPKVLLETAKCHFKTIDEVLKQAGHTREDLGPEGQARSKAGPYRPRAKTPSC